MRGSGLEAAVVSRSDVSSDAAALSESPSRSRRKVSWPIGCGALLVAGARTPVDVSRGKRRQGKDCSEVRPVGAHHLLLELSVVLARQNGPAPVRGVGGREGVELSDAVVREAVVVDANEPDETPLDG